MVTACLGSAAFLGLAALPISTPMAAAVLLFLANLEAPVRRQRPRTRLAHPECPSPSPSPFVPPSPSSLPTVPRP